MLTKAIKKPNQPSHIKDLVLLFAIPIGIALIAAIVIYAPSLFANPKYDFIYSTCIDTYCNEGYDVDPTGTIVKVSTNASNQYYDDRNNTATIRYYDAKSDSTRRLTLEEAKSYRLNTSSKSVDGYTLNREENSSGFLFWGDYDSGWYLKNGAKKKKVELSNNDSYSSADIKFLGWVNK